MGYQVLINKLQQIKQKNESIGNELKKLKTFYSSYLEVKVTLKKMEHKIIKYFNQ